MPVGMYGMPAVPQQQGVMMAGAAAGGYMYTPAQQPQQPPQPFQQMQNQLGGLSLGGQPTATPQQAAGWGGMQPATGHTLSTNLWQ
ncbi:hypothetical protein NP493_92g04022 [Ridgeia piscesae]|uniref:Uncharacterized protein n=1 Tax=Ridgeia piscesae TaxID=27915 RepID=A0AAD9UI15_RIDPI|nr:hypothetical protein NP493_92g04022 [Ridgeia piscesae]